MPRKKPFSGKQKKKQLREKKDRKSDNSTDREWKARRGENSGASGEESVEEAGVNFQSKLSERSRKGAAGQARQHDPNRYILNFLRESREELDRRKLVAQTEPLEHVQRKEMETSIEEVYQPGTELDMPQRPEWKYGVSKRSLEQHEEEYFSKYLNDIYSKFGDRHLSYFEHNLETWRQLWRVLERSDIIAMVADVRHPVLHFSPALYSYVTNTLHKPLILVLNKTDLVPAPVVVAWRAYFKSIFPKLHVILFTSFPKDVRSVDDPKSLKKRRPVGKRVYTTQIGPTELFEVCSKLCKDKVDLTMWGEKINSDCARLQEANSEETGAACGGPLHDNATKVGDDLDDVSVITTLAEEGHLTIGFVGHPNVGKSSLMNGLIGKKVVSTSVTPGHTKYFQTYFLTPNVMLCDCPGLVFPSLIDKQMQILSGIYPIAQVQEPYTPVGYLASRIPVIKLLRLTHPDEGDNEAGVKWTAWDVCEAWAEKRRFYTAKGSRPDVYRAANHILRMAVDGRLCTYMLPPNYTKEEKKWIEDPETMKLLSFSLKPGEKIAARLHETIHEDLVGSEVESIESSSDEMSSSEEDGDRGDAGDAAMENKFALLCGDD